MDSERPEEAEELGSELTKCVGSERRKVQALFVIFGGVEVTFILLHGLQSVPFQDMTAFLGVAHVKSTMRFGGHWQLGKALRTHAASSDHKIATLHGVRLSNGHKPKASC